MLIQNTLPWVHITDTFSTWETIIQAIHLAQKEIFIKSFIWRDDALGRYMANALLNAAQRWVQIRIEKDKWWLYHEWSEPPHQSFLHTRWDYTTYVYTAFRRSSYVKQKAVNTLRNKLLSHKNVVYSENSSHYIDHSKVFIIDDILYIWWMNIWDEYDGKWIDFMVWIWIQEIWKKVQNLLSDWGSICWEKDGTSFEIYRDTWKKSQHNLHINKITEAIESATSRIIIMWWYLWNDVILSCIEKKIKSNPNIQLHIIFPSTPNIQKINMQKALRFVSEKCPWAQITFTQKMIHGKILVVDDITLIWSWNFDGLSWEKTSELWIILQWDEITQSLISFIEKIKEENKNIQTELSRTFWAKTFRDRFEYILQNHVI